MGGWRPPFELSLSKLVSFFAVLGAICSFMPAMWELGSLCEHRPGAGRFNTSGVRRGDRARQATAGAWSVVSQSAAAG
jgi:hypothetical protein